MCLGRVTYCPPEPHIDEEIGALGAWLSSWFESGPIAASPGGPGYEIEDFTPILAHEPKKHMQKYRRLMVF